jgi:hypothetical protein
MRWQRRAGRTSSVSTVVRRLQRRVGVARVEPAMDEKARRILCRKVRLEPRVGTADWGGWGQRRTLRSGELVVAAAACRRLGEKSLIWNESMARGPQVPRQAHPFLILWMWFRFSSSLSWGWDFLVLSQGPWCTSLGLPGAEAHGVLLWTFQPPWANTKTIDATTTLWVTS